MSPFMNKNPGSRFPSVLLKKREEEKQEEFRSRKRNSKESESKSDPRRCNSTLTTERSDDETPT